MYTLSGTLEGHEQDVRAVSTIDNTNVLSALRDATVRLWKKSNSWTATPSLIAHTAESTAFVNALVYIPDRQIAASGGQEGIVYLSEVGPAASFDGEPEGALIGHTKNVCSLSYGNGTLVSSSWDSTAIVWDLDTREAKYHLKGHQASVWDALALSKTDFLTASADGTIRRWQGNATVKTYQGHRDVVRKLAVLQDGKSFASCSNDGSIIVWDLESGLIQYTLQGHESFIYDLAVLPQGDLVLTGEDRTVRVWLTKTRQILQVLTLPCISVWCCDTFPNGDIVAGGSDNCLRVFTRDSARFASPGEIAALSEAVSLSSIAEESLDNLKKTDIPSFERLNTPGKKEGEVVMVKSAEGVIEAHQWSSGLWTKIGDVVGGGKSDTKKEYLGVEYDYVFDVDIEDGKPPLKLPFNKTDNPYEAATKFLSDNELPASYANEVVNFIMQNTGGLQLDSQPSPVENPYLPDRNTHPKQKPAHETVLESSIFPQINYISFSDFKVEQLIKGLQKFNNEQDSSLQLSEGQLKSTRISLDLLALKDALFLITDIVSKVLTWPITSRLIGYDILRVCVGRLNIADTIQLLVPAEVVSKVVSEGIASSVISSDVPSLMVLTRLLCNLVPTVLFKQLYFTSSEEGAVKFSQDFVAILNHLQKAISVVGATPNHKQYNPFMTAIATLLFDLSVMQIKAKEIGISAGKTVVEFANQVGQTVVESSSEAAYRCVVSFGNFKHALVLKQQPEYVDFARTLYADNKKEKRFVEVFRLL